MYRIGDINFDLIRVKPNSKQPLYDSIESSIDNSYSDMSLVIPKNIVVVDADDEDVARVLFKMYKDKTHWVKTSRGYHFYFKVNPKSVYFPSNFEASRFSSKRYTLLGLKVDYKKNLPMFNNNIEHKEAVKVKADGVIRESKNDFISELPFELYPLYKNVENNVSDLFGIIDLDSDRNSTIVSIIGSLLTYANKYNYSPDLIERTIRSINEYVFKEPLPSNEIDTLVSRISYFAKSRDNISDGFNTQTYTQNVKYEGEQNDTRDIVDGDVAELVVSSGVNISNTTKLVDLIVNYIAKNYILVRYQSHLYIKNRDVNNVKFEDCTDPIDMGVFLESLGIYILSKTFVNDIIFKCEIKARHVEDEEMSVIFKNGYVLDQETGNVNKYNNEFSNIIIETEYHKPKLLHELSSEEIYYRDMVDGFINFVSDGGINESFYIRDENNPSIHDGGEYARLEVESVIDQILGHCLMTKKLPQYAYFFTGSSGANGKSTLFNVIKGLVGNRNTTSLSLDQLSENYTLSTMTKSLINIGDDINDSFIESSREFKTIVTNNPIVVREIKEAPFETRIFSTLLYNCNEMPKFKDKSGGIERRLKIIPMMKKIPEHKRRNDLEDILTHPFARQRLLERALIGFKKLRQNKSVIKFGRVIDMESEKYFLLIDTIKGFLYDEVMKDNEINSKNLEYNEKVKLVVDKWLFRPLGEIYSMYKEFCDNDGRNYSVSKNKFKQKIENDFNLVSKYELKDWVFLKGSDTIYSL